MAAILPRGNAKTTLAAPNRPPSPAHGPSASVTIGAASAAQARICFERMLGLLLARDVQGRITRSAPRTAGHESYAESARPAERRPAVGEQAHGLSSTPLHRRRGLGLAGGGALLEAMQTGLVKRPDSKLLLISTAAARSTPRSAACENARWRRRSVKRSGVTGGPRELTWLEWSLPEEASLDAMAQVKKVNPAPWIHRRRPAAAAQLRDRPGVHAVPREPLGRVRRDAWLPAGAWQRCAGEPTSRRARRSGSAWTSAAAAPTARSSWSRRTCGCRHGRGWATTPFSRSRLP